MAVLSYSLVNIAMAQEKTRWPNGRIILVNHRGLSSGYPENTLITFRNSIGMGVDVIELDLRGTKDRVPVVMHDKTVHRTTNGTGTVSNLPLSELKKLDAGRYVNEKFSGERVPTYEEVLETVFGTGIQLLLDIKRGRSLDRFSVVRLTERYRGTLNVIVGARTTRDIRLFRSLNPNIRILGFVKSTDLIQPFIAAGADMIRLWPKWIYANPALVKQVHRQGRPVWTTANDAPRQELLNLINLGVNGILTDLPEVLAQLIREIERGTIRLRSNH